MAFIQLIHAANQVAESPDPANRNKLLEIKDTVQQNVRDASTKASVDTMVKFADFQLEAH